MYANPGAERPLPLLEFAPIPRLIVVRQTETERELQYLGAQGQVLEGRALKAWKHVP